MGKAGLVTAEGLGAVRKYAIVAILVLAAVVTPPDVTTQLILFVVVYGLYEISIWLVRMVEKKRDARLRAEGYFDDEDGSDTDDTRPTATTATDPEADEDFDDPLLREFDEDLAREAKERDEKDGKA